MAASLFRRTTGSGCLHRELCRVVWRPQAAPFSSKASDRKQPRRTHIKKVKPQPVLDVSKLLEQLFSQRRPAGKARPTKPPSTSSVNLSSSNVSTTSASSPTTTEPSAGIIETKAETADPSSSPAATVEPTIESPVEPFLSHVETLEVRAAAGEGPVEPTVDITVDATAQEVETSSTDLGLVNLSHIAEEPLIETTVEYPIETSHFPVETLETKAAVVEGPVEPTVETTVESAVQEVETNSADSGLVNLWHTEEPLIETTVEPAVEARTGSGSLPLENESRLESTVNVGVNGSEEMTGSDSEATDTVEAVMQAAILVSDQRWRQALEATDQKAGNESRDESGDQQILKAVSLEVQPSLESLESVSQTRAEAVSGEKKMEVEVPGHRTEEVKREDSLDDLDPIQRLFLDKIREYKDMRRLNGGQLVTDPGYEKYVSEETAKLQRLYGGGDLSNFPQFTFTELKMDQNSK